MITGNILGMEGVEEAVVDYILPQLAQEVVVVVLMMKMT